MIPEVLQYVEILGFTLSRERETERERREREMEMEMEMYVCMYRNDL